MSEINWNIGNLKADCTCGGEIEFFHTSEWIQMKCSECGEKLYLYFRKEQIQK